MVNLDQKVKEAFEDLVQYTESLLTLPQLTIWHEKLNVLIALRQKQSELGPLGGNGSETPYVLQLPPQPEPAIKHFEQYETEE